MAFGLGWVLAAPGCFDPWPANTDGNAPDAARVNIQWRGGHAGHTGHDYCVSPDGDDARSGRCPDQSWRSIERVNWQALQPGDQVSFEAGFDYRGSYAWTMTTRAARVRPCGSVRSVTAVPRFRPATPAVS